MTFRNYLLFLITVNKDLILYEYENLNKRRFIVYLIKIT